MTHASLAALIAALTAIACTASGDDHAGAGGSMPAGVGGAGAQGGAAPSGAGAQGGGAPGGAGAGGEVDAALVKEWARQVTLDTEFGRSDGRVARWATSPRLSVIEGSAADRADLLDLLPVLDDLIAPIAIELVADGDETAEIEVYFAPLASFEGIAAANGFRYVPGNWGYFYTFWSAETELTKAYILLANDLLEGSELRHFTFEETTQSLGLGTDSPIFPDSVFFAAGDDGGSAQELSELDRRLVRFLYTHLTPGDDLAAFDAQFDAHFFD
jgi:hypothetical protein